MLICILCIYIHTHTHNTHISFIMAIRVRVPINELNGRKWKHEPINNGSIRKSRSQTSRLIVTFTSEKTYQETSKRAEDDSDDADDATSSDDDDDVDMVPKRNRTPPKHHRESSSSSSYGEHQVIAALRRRCLVHNVEVAAPVVTASDREMNPDTVKCRACGRLQNASWNPTYLVCGCRACLACFKETRIL